MHTAPDLLSALIAGGPPLLASLGVWVSLEVPRRRAWRQQMEPGTLLDPEEYEAWLQVIGEPAGGEPETVTEGTP